MGQINRVLPSPHHIVKLRIVIIDLLPGGHPTIEQAAASLGISVRTLQRRLQVLGFSYSELLEQTRMEHACFLLDRSNIHLAEVARTLGYSDPGSFSRAFRRWKAMSPRAYRQSSSAD